MQTGTATNIFMNSFQNLEPWNVTTSDVPALTEILSRIEVCPLALAGYLPENGTNLWSESDCQTPDKPRLRFSALPLRQSLYSLLALPHSDKSLYCALAMHNTQQIHHHGQGIYCFRSQSRSLRTAIIRARQALLALLK